MAINDVLILKATRLDAIVSIKGFWGPGTINQSKFIFQAMTNNYNLKIINVTALERLPEKHYAH